MNSLSKFFKLSLLILFTLILFSGMSAYTAANTISNSHVGQYSDPIGPNDLKPAACMGISLSNIVSIGDGGSATNGNDLIAGTPNRDLFSGLDGNDCILGGDGDDSLYFIFIFLSLDGLHGGNGNDVILGGAGTDILYGEGGNDILNGGGGTDLCISGGGNDQFIDCEYTR